MKFKRFSGTGSQCQIEPKYLHSCRQGIDFDNGYSRQLLLRCSNDSHPCENIVKINNAACKPFKINLGELASDSITADNFFHIE
ncbi:hypothetical protein FGD67_11090 [Colwellia sp. M166]|nr:hypothetical protein FGD67_11090 [Colwellia sp. M166]